MKNSQLIRTQFYEFHYPQFWFFFLLHYCTLFLNLLSKIIFLKLGKDINRLLFNNTFKHIFLNKKHFLKKVLFHRKTTFLKQVLFKEKPLLYFKTYYPNKIFIKIILTVKSFVFTFRFISTWQSLHSSQQCYLKFTLNTHKN